MNSNKIAPKIKVWKLYDLPLTDDQFAEIRKLAESLDLFPGELVSKTLEIGLLELSKENKEKYRCQLYRALEETEENSRSPL